MATIATPSGVPMVVRELTLRGIVLGALITLLFTAANVYLGLKIGITFATSIPAAVISMAVLQLLQRLDHPGKQYRPDHRLGGGHAVGDHLRPARAGHGRLVDRFSLLAVGRGDRHRRHPGRDVFGAAAARARDRVATFPIPKASPPPRCSRSAPGSAGPKRTAAASPRSSELAGLGGLSHPRQDASSLPPRPRRTFRFGAGATSASTSLSMALIGVGHLVGMAVGIAMLVGLIISWVRAGAVADRGRGAPAAPTSTAFVSAVFRNKVRFIGAGTIGVAAIWTLLKIIGPIIKGIARRIAANRARRAGGRAALDLTERDLPISIVGGDHPRLDDPDRLAARRLRPAAARSPPIPARRSTVSIVYILIAGVVIAAVCGYMAGLIGASNSPISGVGILSVLGISLILAALFGPPTPTRRKALVAFALFVTAIIFGIATISNDNLQDLKTGQLVGATPWRQQVALVLGVIFGAVVIPPILDLLNDAFGFHGAPGAGPNALAAPQAALISAIAQGVLGGNLDWNLIGLGAAIGVAVVIVDELLRSGNEMRLPPLAVGMGIYLPMALTSADPGRRAARLLL